jgi:hypothetical protein
MWNRALTMFFSNVLFYRKFYAEYGTDFLEFQNLSVFSMVKNDVTCDM